MVLIVNTTTDTSITEELRKSAAQKGIDMEILEAGSMRISPCIGCNYCWLKTPGVCSVQDDYEVILKRVIHADQLWVIAETALGFLNHKGKNIFDRIIPIATMYLKFEGGQMRHVLRYDQKTDIGILYLGELDREYLSRWNERTALNLGGKSLGVFPVQEKGEAVSCMC